MRVGFIGLGTMGASMALNTLKGGHALVVHDINRNAAAPHLEAGATWADTPRQVMEACDVVFTSLPGPPEVQAVALGEHGLLHGVRPGKVYFDLSTNSPTLMRHLHDMFAKMGAHVLDAPVSGGPHGDTQLSEVPNPPEEQAYYGVEEEFTNAIRGTEEITMVPFETGVHYMEWTEAVIRSAHTGQAIYLPL
jgi:6-phosphogluconate dehydrogenase (decarboxylating)